MIYVIGSGPAAFGTILGIVNQGIRCTVLDAGINLENEKVEIVNKMKNRKSTEWCKDEIDQVRGNVNASIKGVARKKKFNSEFPYQDIEKFFPLKKSKFSVVSSLAKGGLSNVWGGAMLPYTSKDIKDWPITVEDLEESYKAILKEINFSAEKDDLEKIFPLYKDKLEHLNKNPQAISLLKSAVKYKKSLDKGGITVGSSRLAVKGERTQSNGCCYCGLCLSGCPYEYIFETKSKIDHWIDLEKIDYINNIIVKKVEEVNGEINIHAVDRITNKNKVFKGSRVFVAAGVRQTSSIILNSSNDENISLPLVYSQYFTLPILKFNAEKKYNENVHTLAQLFVEIDNKNVSGNLVHLQIYTYNEFYETVLKNFFKFIYVFIKPLVQFMLKRLIVVQGYLHSNESPTFTLKKEGSQIGIFLNEVRSEKRVVFNVKKALMRYAFKLKILPLMPFSNIGVPFDGTHLGGTFPMKKNPKNFQTDIWGKLYGFEKIHIVDSSNFPSIPASTITLTVMANAHRISSHIIKKEVKL